MLQCYGSGGVLEFACVVPPLLFSLLGGGGIASCMCPCRVISLLKSPARIMLCVRCYFEDFDLVLNLWDKLYGLGV